MLTYKTERGNRLFQNRDGFKAVVYCNATGRRYECSHRHRTEMSAEQCAKKLLKQKCTETEITGE